MNKKNFILLFCLSMALWPTYQSYAKEPNAFVSTVQQNDKRISGIVTDINGESLVGASIHLEGTAVGTIADLNGKFSLEVPARSTLTVSCVGYVTQKFIVTTESNYTIRLKEDFGLLDEVVVIGYGTMKKGDVTSAVSSVKSEDFNKGAVRDAMQLIQGKIAGLSIITPSGDPTQGTEILLRGVTTIKSGTSPLVLIDGVPGSLNSVAPEDIESIDVLKDGSAAAIYGTRGTNGVIIITTKQVQGATKPTLSYSGKVSAQSIVGKLNFMSADQYRSFMKDADGFKDWGQNTNWLDEVTRTPIVHEHNLSFKAGTDKATIISNVNFKDNPGIFLRTGTTDFKARMEASYKILNDRLTFNLAVLTSQREYWPRFNSEIYRQALMRNPTDTPKDENGRWIDRPEVYWYYNPLQSIYESDGEYKSNYNQLNGSAILKIMDGWNMKLLLSRYNIDAQSGTYDTSNSVSGYRENRNGVAGRSYSHSESNLLELTTDYKVTFGKHNIVAMAGYSYQKVMNESFSASNWNFPSDIYSYNNLAMGAGLKAGLAGMGSGKDSSKLIGFFARASYNFSDKYLLLASLRYEGSSKFGVDNKWGAFPSVSVGWRINEEAFLKDVEYIDNLKLRVGYGVTGIDLTNSYQSLSSINYNTSSQFWTENGWIPELIPARNPNPNLRWESKHETNIGIDYAFLDNRIYGNIDYYMRKTKDALWDYKVLVPPYIYTSMMANVGVLKNKGIEISLGLNPVRTNNFRWNTIFNYSTNSNKLVSLSNDEFIINANFIDFGSTGEPIQTTTHRLEIGGKIGDFWGWKSVDVDNEGIWVIETPEGERISYKDAKAEHKQVLGNGLPKHYFSWNNSLSYKNFDLEVNMRGAAGFDILNFPRMYYENPKLAQYNRLTSAMDPVFGKNIRLTNDLAFVSYYIEKGDYLKIDNVSFGYTFNAKKLNFVNNLRLFFSCSNLLTITGYKGIDPEVNTVGLTPGNDYRDKFPTTRTFTLGLNITL